MDFPKGVIGAPLLEYPSWKSCSYPIRKSRLESKIKMKAGWSKTKSCNANRAQNPSAFTPIANSSAPTSSHTKKRPPKIGDRLVENSKPPPGLQRYSSSESVRFHSHSQQLSTNILPLILRVSMASPLGSFAPHYASHHTPLKHSTPRHTISHHTTLHVSRILKKRGGGIREAPQINIDNIKLI